MNKRNLKLEKYGISGKRYKELCGFCEQYPDWKTEFHNIVKIKSKKMDGMPYSYTGSTSDPTSDMAIKTMRIQSNIDLIESVAKEASEDLWVYIIKSVCYEHPFWYIRDVMNIPCSERTFYDRRRYFFYLLDKRKS